MSQACWQQFTDVDAGKKITFVRDSDSIYLDSMHLIILT